ncbi:MAG: helix-turn-helix transcriptional regulator [Clostridia bacterium]|nr:helix-turn-helix transcriptional regulator [Clostridia bacterium]
MRLKELRGNVTQEKIANDLNISQKVYSNYETGFSEPNLKKLIEIADYFHVSLDYLCEHITEHQFQIGHLDEQSKEIMSLIQPLDKEGKAKVIGYINGLSGN